MFATEAIEPIEPEDIEKVWNQLTYSSISEWYFLTLELVPNSMFLFFAIKNCRLFDNAIQRNLLSSEQYSVLFNHCMLGNTLK